ncbi:MAG: Gfo/Idh/MocA family oxidoreductase [Planctomycetota bacterium]|nr:Gfo/Idh/MocA family oxidoreductase [Planctomycetota bacterium]
MALAGNGGKMHFKVGVIGATGFIGVPYRAEVREAAADAEIVAVCARRRGLLEAAAREDGAAVATDEWRDVVTHPDVNLVIVATPDALHHEAVLECAANGKHLLCEKPIGLNVQEAADIWAAYRDTALAHFVPFWTRYVPAFVRGREIVRAGTLGEIRSVVYRWHNPRPDAMPFTWRDDATLSSAGSIADVGSHAYDTMRWMLGEDAVKVLAHADVITPAKPDLGDVNLDEALRWGGDHAIDDSDATRKATASDYAAIAFEMAGGAVGSLILSHAPFLRKGLAPELELHGRDASLAVDRLRSRVTIVRGDGEPSVERVEDPGFGNRFARHVFPALTAMIEEGSTEHPNLHDGWRVQCFTDAAAISAERGSWVSLAEFASDD